MVVRHIKALSGYAFQMADKHIFGIGGPASAAMGMAMGNLLWSGRNVLILQNGWFSGRFAEMAEKEQFILTVCANGYGKLSSAYEYRRIGRGGQGITNIDNIGRNGPVVVSFAATKSDQLMLVTDQAKLIRIGLDSLRVIGRGSAGVRLFDVAPGEHVVSAVRIDETTEPENDAEEAIVEEMVARSAEETEIPKTQDRDDQTESDDGEGDEA